MALVCAAVSSMGCTDSSFEFHARLVDRADVTVVLDSDPAKREVSRSFASYADATRQTIGVVSVTVAGNTDDIELRAGYCASVPDLGTIEIEDVVLEPNGPGLFVVTLECHGTDGGFTLIH